MLAMGSTRFLSVALPALLKRILLGCALHTYACFNSSSNVNKIVLYFIFFMSYVTLINLDQDRALFLFLRLQVSLRVSAS